MHQIKLAEIYFRIVCLCIFAALPVLLLFSLCFLEASFCKYICMYASQNNGRGQRRKRGKTGEISRSFCWCGSFQLSVCGLTFRLFALKVPSQRPQDFTPELCTATLILGTILLFSLQVTDRNSKLVRQDRLTKKLSAVYVSLRLMVKLQMHTCKRPGNFQGTNQTDTVFAFYRYSQVTFSRLPQC